MRFACPHIQWEGQVSKKGVVVLFLLHSNQGLYLDDKRAPLFKLFISALFGEPLQSVATMYLVVKLVRPMENGLL